MLIFTLFSCHTPYEWKLTAGLTGGSVVIFQKLSNLISPVAPLCPDGYGNLCVIRAKPAWRALSPGQLSLINCALLIRRYRALP